MKKAILPFLFILFCSNSYSQTRLNMQSGINVLTEEGFHGNLNSSLGLSFRYKNNFSWGLNYGIVSPRKINGRANFLYCDSLGLLGWGGSCASGNDSLVLSGFTYSYSRKVFSAKFLFHTSIKEKSEFAYGLNMGLHYFKRKQDIHNDLFPEDRTDDGYAASFTLLNRYSYYPFQSKSNGELFVESSIGLFLSPHPDCTDGGCYNFMERTLNATAYLQFGFALNLN
jgi:hypothetical protein